MTSTRADWPFISAECLRRAGPGATGFAGEAYSGRRAAGSVG